MKEELDSCVIEYGYVPPMLILASIVFAIIYIVLSLTVQ